ncbi:gamma-glutamyl-gamma-aminobutyrate hydrolase family protein [Mycolicibacterium palauense]|uniref:gamma-glutamyl-gamma-aminobutyrate hydrolase family protein n=1 Tax=Mycolicibacterium palauense TaxID=2034511 RepID=UPI000BFF0DBA|nr:gamma-glutamyl-gamma-aminobutyrate hydrolase family protein [Mycolicibacterium palauense]
MTVRRPPPLIAVTGRRVDGDFVRDVDPRFRGEAIDMYYASYSESLLRAGASSAYVPYEALGRGCLGRFDGLVLSGGQDISAAVSGALTTAEEVEAPGGGPGEASIRRDNLELDLLREAFTLDIPVLGVCRGAQLLNVAHGGSLVAHLPRSSVQHNDPSGPPAQSHSVRFVPGTLAHSVFSAHRTVNSWHHQAVDVAGRGVVVAGRSADDVVEAIEIPGRRVLGVQWHPELTPGIDPALQWLVEEAAAAAVRASGRVSA